MKRLLEQILKILAIATIRRYRPGVIGVTGSVGKTSAKKAITAVLGSARRVRSAQGNFNNEIGLPLSIISDEKDINGIFFWPKIILKAIKNLIIKIEYPEVLILEYAIDRPGDMRYLLSIARPDIGVITAVGDVPVHVEFFKGPQDVAREKGKLIECLSTKGFAILNADDKTVTDLGEKTRAHIMTYGYSKNAHLRISNISYQSEDNMPTGVSFKLEQDGNVVPVVLDHVFGKSQTYAAAAAASVGLIFGINLVRIAEVLHERYRSPDSRLQLIRGIHETNIIDDSYNASPLSMREALSTLEDLKGTRKVAVLGDMREIGVYAVEEHEKIGRIAAKFLDILITVGPHAKFIADAATKSGMARHQVLSYDSVDSAGDILEKSLRKGDLVLIKASRAIHLEKIIEGVKAF